MNEQSKDIERAVAILTIEHKILTPIEAWEAITRSRKEEKPLVEYILSSIPDTIVVSALANAYGIKFYDLYSTKSDYVFDYLIYYYYYQRYSMLIYFESEFSLRELEKTVQIYF